MTPISDFLLNSKAPRMADLFASGRIIDAILLLVALEAMAIAIYHRATGRGVALGDVVWTLASGAALMLALRIALTGGAWTAIAAPLTAALVTHLVDLVRRWR
jgi:hypothetical protein